MVCVQTLTDDIGGKHYTYKQYFKGVEVYPIILRVHDYIGKGLIVNGRVVAGLNLNFNGLINFSTALNTAKKATNATAFAWEDYNAEATLKANTSDSNATYYPDSQIVILKKRIGNSTNGPSEFMASYRISMATLEPEQDKTIIYVDAKENVVNYFDQHKCYDKKPAYLPNYGFQDSIHVTIDSTLKKKYGFSFTTKDDNSYYHLFDGSQLNHRLLVRFGTNGTSSSNLFSAQSYSSIGSNINNFASEALWSTEKYYEMMKTKFGNQFLSNIKLRNYIGWNYADSIPFQLTLDDMRDDHYSHYQPKFSIGDCIVIGKNASTNKYTTSLDVIGHEWTHHFSYEDLQFRPNGLKAEGEAGALGESFSDMFGFALQEYMIPITGKQRNWKYGLDYVPTKGYRNMENPPTNGDPDYYEGALWENTSCCIPNGKNDNCGVHSNCGISNKWFYALVQGTTISKNGITFTIAAQDLDKVMNVVWNTILYFTTPEMHFLDARNATEIIAENVYGANSSIKNNISIAWDAVGVKKKIIPSISTATININANSPDLLQGLPIAVWNTERFINSQILIDSGYTLYITNHYCPE